MNILQITAADYGGAGMACIRLHQGMLDSGIESDVLVMIKKNDFSRVHELFEYKNPGFLKKNYFFFKKGFFPLYNRFKMLYRENNYEFFSQPRTLLDITKHPLYHNADIIHLHWISHFVDYKSFFRKNIKPVVWTLHDMNPFTGGCHYSMDCNLFKEECQACPQLQGTFDLKYAHKNFKLKMKSHLSTNNLNPVFPSKWLMNLTSESNLLGKFPHHHILNGVNTDEFHLIKKDEAREHFNLPNDKKILLFVADRMDNLRKGFSILIETFRLLKNSDDILLCSVGNFQDYIDLSGLNHENLGYLNTPLEMNTAYSAADAFIIPSLEDNLPNTIIESHLSGTPVIGFPSGGIIEMTDHGETGLLSENKSPESLALVINEFLEHTENFSKVKIRQSAIKKYSLQNQTKKYIDLYSKIID